MYSHRRVAMADGSSIESDGSDIDVQEGERIGDFDEELLNLHNIEHVEIDCERDPLLEGFFASDDEDEDEIEGFDFEWKTENFTRRNLRPFRKEGGATFQHPPDAEAQHYFELLVGQAFWEHLTTETNRYAEQERQKNPPTPHAPKWTPVDIPTMKAFIGLVFCMGIIQCYH